MYIFVLLLLHHINCIKWALVIIGEKNWLTQDSEQTVEEQNEFRWKLEACLALRVCHCSTYNIFTNYNTTTTLQQLTGVLVLQIMSTNCI